MISFVRPSRRLGLRTFVVLALAWMGCSVPAQASDPIRVTFLRPDPGTPVFDRVDVEVAVETDLEIERVELRFDGAVVGRKTQPPWSWSLDVGSGNRDRVFYADVFLASGVSYRAEHLAPRFKADEEIELDLRQLYSTVTDRKGERALGLSRDEFRLMDEGEVQELVTFESGDVPFTAVLLVDGSQSVQREALDIVLAGARRFVQNLRENDEVKVMFFGDRVTGSTPWGGPDDDIGERLETLADGLTDLTGSAIFDHLYLALLRGETRQGRRVVIVLTDGWDLHSALRADQVEEAALRTRSQVFVVRRSYATVQRLQHRAALAAPKSSYRTVQRIRGDFIRLEEIAQATGGRVLDIDEVGEVEGALQEVLAELRGQYVLGYYPSMRRGDGARHEVNVDVQRGGLDVRYRESYVE